MSIPYGYRVENGAGIIEPGEATRVKALFQLYLDGATLASLPELTGIQKGTSSIRNMLTDKRYLGTKLYPRIIEDELFQKVGDKREKDKTANKKPPRVKPIPAPLVSFTMREAEKHYDDPFQEAAYLYTLIDEKEKTNG